jgi:hypothetical protein
MKKILLLIILICPLSIYADDATQTNFRNMLTDLDNIISSNPSNELFKMFCVVKNKAMSKEFIYQINRTLPKSIYGGAEFTPKQEFSDKTFIGIGPYLIELYGKKPSIVLSILIHEHVHAFHYFDNPNYFIFFLNNPLEQFLFEFDATYYEAMFIENYLVPKKYELTKFEDFLLQSYKNRQLPVFLMYFQGYNYNVAFQMYKIRKSEEKFNDKLSKLESLGNEIISNCKQNAQDEKSIKYNKIVTLFTYRKFIGQTIFDILNMNDSTKISAKDFSLTDYKDINKVYQEIEKSLSEDDIKFLSTFKEEVRNKYEKID